MTGKKFKLGDIVKLKIGENRSLITEITADGYKAVYIEGAFDKGRHFIADRKEHWYEKVRNVLE